MIIGIIGLILLIFINYSELKEYKAKKFDKNINTNLESNNTPIIKTETSFNP